MAARELTHGLGIFSILENYQQMRARKISYVAPALGYYGTPKQIKMLPFTIFDSFLHYKTTSFAELGQIFYKSKWSPSTLWKNTLGPFFDTVGQDQWINEFENSKDLLNVAKILYSYSKSSDLAAVLSDGTRIPLANTSPLPPKDGRDETPQPLTEFNFLSVEFDNTADFLTTRDIKAGDTLNSLMERANSEYLFGPNTLKLLEAIGYATRNQPEMVRIEYLVVGPANEYRPI